MLLTMLCIFLLLGPRDFGEEGDEDTDIDNSDNDNSSPCQRTLLGNGKGQRKRRKTLGMSALAITTS